MECEMTKQQWQLTLALHDAKDRMLPDERIFIYGLKQQTSLTIDDLRRLDKLGQKYRRYIQLPF
jgi:hypothetical protein